MLETPGMIHEDDVILWPDGNWCYRRELMGYAPLEGVEIIHHQTPRWFNITEA